MNPVINFMYFANNFGLHHLDQIFSRLNNPDHFRAKFEKARGNNGTAMFLNWFMELSDDNKEIVTDYISQKYSYK